MTIEMNLEELLNFNELHDQVSIEPVHQNSPETRQITKQVEYQKNKSQQMTVSDYLVAFTTQSHSFSVGCVDMVNSTKISAYLSKKKLTDYYETFLNSMARIIGNYDGKVIKNIGDCLLYYFPLSKDGNNIEGLVKSMDCGIAMIKAQQMISQKLVLNGLPGLNYRVSADYGNVMIMNANNSTEIDMIGAPVNMCSKINHTAKSNEFVIGGDFHEVIKKINKFKFKQVHEYDIGLKAKYPIYKVEIQ